MKDGIGREYEVGRYYYLITKSPRNHRRIGFFLGFSETGLPRFFSEGRLTVSRINITCPIHEDFYTKEMQEFAIKWRLDNE